MHKTSLLIALSLVLFSCKETEFSPGLENRVIAIIDMAPETYSAKVDFTSDDQVGGCSDHEAAYIDQWLDGSTDNVYYSIRIEAKDYFKSENIVMNLIYMTHHRSKYNISSQLLPMLMKLIIKCI